MQPISRRRALQGFAAAFAGAVTSSWARAAEPALTFLAVGDWGRDGAFNQSAVARQMGLVADAIGSSFVISVGDNFYEDGVTGLDDPKWRTSFEDVYAAPSLQTPWHVVLGNHDYHGNTDAQIAYSANSPRWKMPARWFSRREKAPDGATLDIFFIDTTPFITFYKDPSQPVKLAGHDADNAAQLAWLDGALAASGADWKIVIGHHPIYSGVDAGKAPPTGDMIAQVDPILRRHAVPLYVNGHDHDLQHVFKGATHYVCTGAGSKMLDACHDGDGSDFCSVKPGFTALRLTSRRLEVAYRDSDGDELHVVDIDRPA